MEEKFKNAVETYEALGDADKRKITQSERAEIYEKTGWEKCIPIEAEQVKEVRKKTG